MKKWIWIGALMLLIGAGYLGFQHYKIYLPGIIGQWREPIAENRPVEWAQGPSAPPSGKRPTNVILIVADDLGMNDISLYGGGVAGGAVPTPNIDRLAKQSWFFKNFYVPVTGTAKTVWASISGVPDVSRDETSTRNPLITRQHSLVNALQGYDRYYMIGGNSGWANMKAMSA